MRGAEQLTHEHLFRYSYVMATAQPRHASEGTSLAEARPRLLSGAVAQSVAEVFKLLGDTTRVRLLDTLSHGERCVGELAALTGQSESAISHQLRLLRAARLVRVRRAGRHAHYSLDDHHVIGLLRETRKHVGAGGE